MGMCLDTEDCRFQNRDKARFCAKCGIPTQGALLQGRYEIQYLISKDYSTVSLRAIDRYERLPVIVRALIPNKCSEETREIFMQDAELAAAFSSRINEAGSIRVTDYGQDGPVAFLVKSELNDSTTVKHSVKLRMTMRVSKDVFQPKQSAYDDLEDGDMQTMLRPVVPKASDIPSTATPAPVPQEEAKPQPRHDWLADGDQAYELGNYEEAFAAYEAALADNAVSVEAWSGTGATLLHLGHAGEALFANDKPPLLQSDQPELSHSRTNGLHDLQRYNQEKHCYDRALALDANYVFA